MEEFLSYNDVALVPQYNNIESRNDPDISTWLTNKTRIKTPLVPANMDTVIGRDLAQVLIENGGIPIFHRYSSFEEQIQLVTEFRGQCFISCGLSKYEQTKKLLEAGARGVNVDVSYAHSLATLNFIRKLRADFPDKEIIAGNVCTVQGYNDLVNAGCNAVKVNVGPGAACTTRIKTGFGLPTFTTVQKIGKVAQKLRIPIIADGGIVYEKDMAIAIAAGASTVMCGKLFVQTAESASSKVDINGRLYCKYRGLASAEFQTDHYGGLKPGTVAEGVSMDLPVLETAQELIDRFNGAFKSALTYGGARDIKEFQRKAEFVRVTNNYIPESHPRL